LASARVEASFFGVAMATMFERAFELAEGGQLENIETIRDALLREGFRDADEFLSSVYVCNQLQRQIEKANRRVIIR
jgi:hypothetical protein